MGGEGAGAEVWGDEINEVRAGAEWGAVIKGGRGRVEAPQPRVIGPGRNFGTGKEMGGGGGGWVSPAFSFPVFLIFSSNCQR